MSIGLLFWVIFVIGLIFGGWSWRQAAAAYHDKREEQNCI